MRAARTVRRDSSQRSQGSLGLPQSRSRQQLSQMQATRPFGGEASLKHCIWCCGPCRSLTEVFPGHLLTALPAGDPPGKHQQRPTGWGLSYTYQGPEPVVARSHHAVPQRSASGLPLVHFIHLPSCLPSREARSKCKCASNRFPAFG